MINAAQQTADHTHC